MMNQCNCSLRDHLSQRLDKALSDSSSACTEFLHAKDHCCTLVFMLYLCFYCKDVNGLVEDLQRIVLDIYGKHSNAS